MQPVTGSWPGIQAAGSGGYAFKLDLMLLLLIMQVKAGRSSASVVALQTQRGLPATGPHLQPWRMVKELGDHSLKETLTF